MNDRAIIAEARARSVAVESDLNQFRQRLSETSRIIEDVTQRAQQAQMAAAGNVDPVTADLIVIVGQLNRSLATLTDHVITHVECSRTLR